MRWCPLLLSSLLSLGALSAPNSPPTEAPPRPEATTATTTPATAAAEGKGDGQGAVAAEATLDSLLVGEGVGVAFPDDDTDDDDAVAPHQVKSPATEASLAVVRKNLLTPLAEKDEKRSRFSRARLPPRERRIRATSEPQKDDNGRAFVAFAVDDKRGFGPNGGWDLASIVGCVYAASGDVFVQSGESIRPAGVLLGKKGSLTKDKESGARCVPAGTTVAVAPRPE